MSMRTISWQIETQGDDMTVVFEGEINEAARLEPCLEEIGEPKGILTMNLEDVRRLNSSGVRHWVNFMRALAELEEVKEIIYVKCSVAIISQVNMIKDFQGPARIESFFAPYANEDTGDEAERLLRVEEITDPANPPTFKDDEGLWEFDEMPERYFAFLRPE